MGDSNDKPRSNNGASLANEPRFAKALTDRRFAKIKHKDRSIVIDKRFKNILENRNFALAGQKDARGRKGDIIQKAKRRREQKSLQDQFHIASDEEDQEDVAKEDESSQEEPLQAHHANNKSPKAKKAESERISSKHAADGSAPSEKSRPQSDKKSLSKKPRQSAEAAKKEEEEKAYWAQKARGELESNSEEDDNEDGHTSDEFSTDTDEEVAEIEEKELEEGVFQAPMAYGDETHRIAIVNCDWDNIRAVDFFVLCSSFLPPSGALKSVVIFPSDFGLQMLAEEEANGPPIYSSATNVNADTVLKVELEARRKHEKTHKIDEKKMILDQAKLRRYELNKLRYYFAIVTCDSVATASALYAALDNQDVELTANTLDLRFVPDDVSFEDRKVHDSATSIPAKYEPPTNASSINSKTKASLTFDQTPKARTKLTEMAFNKLADADDSKFAALLGSSSSESGSGDEADSESEDESKSKLKKKQRQKYAALLSGLDPDEENGDGQDDFFKAEAGPEGDVEFTIGDKSQKDVDELIKAKVQERLNRKPQKSFTRHRPELVVRPTFNRNEQNPQQDQSDDEEHSQDEEDEISGHESGSIDENGMHIGSMSESFDDSQEMEDDYSMDLSGPHSRPQSTGRRASKRQVSDSEDSDAHGDSDASTEKPKEDVWAGFEESFKKPSKREQWQMKKRKRAEVLAAREADVQGRAELELLVEGDQMTSDEEDSRPSKKRKNGESRDERASKIDLSDPRFAALKSDPRFMPDPTKSQFKKSASVKAILDARQEYRKQHEARPEDEEFATTSSSKTASNGPSSSSSKKSVARGFYDQTIGSDTKTSGAELADLVANIKRKAKPL